MGRHAVSELDGPTVVIPIVSGAEGWRWPDRAPQRQVDVVSAWRTATPARRLAAVAAIAAPVLAIAMSGHSTGSSSSGDPTTSARQAGIAYASELRDAGQSTLSINVNCGVYQSGYTGAQEEAFTLGCTDVTVGMMQDGKL